MATAQEPTTGRPTEPAEAGSRWKFDVAAYHKMAEAGILTEDDRVELIDGDILVMSPIGDRHYGCVAYLCDRLAEFVRGRGIVVAQSPVRADDRSEPEPDVAVLRRREDYYRTGIPRPADVLLLIEVMDSSASHDRGVKLDLYARSGVPEVWLVDLNRELVEVYRCPVDGAFAERREVPRGQSVAPEAFPDAVLGVNDILGRVESEGSDDR